LGKLGFERLDQALDGNEAIEKAAATNYDLILMDCQMPKLDGYEATRRLRAMGIGTPVVAMTAHALSGDREKCLAAGMDDYLTKPIVLDRLVAVLDRWLGRASESVRADSASESCAADANAVFAYDDFLDLLMGDDELADSLLAMFIANTPDDIAKLRQTIACGDAEQVRAAAHSIKGAAANLCATAVNAAAYAIEQAARNGDLAGAAALLARLESAWQTFVSHPRAQRSGATKAV
jgi:CheY-like chemotaxis protein/HPt (histidine-containing phosphotransfer) domain-containing protein